MVSLTKKKRYTREVIEGLLDNRAFINDLKDSDFCHDVIPFLDFERGVERLKLTELEQQLFDIKYNDKMFYPHSNDVLAHELGISDRYVRQTIRSIGDKLEFEMNRGLADD